MDGRLFYLILLPAPGTSLIYHFYNATGPVTNTHWTVILNFVCFVGVPYILPGILCSLCSIIQLASLKRIDSFHRRSSQGFSKETAAVTCTILQLTLNAFFWNTLFVIGYFFIVLNWSNAMVQYKWLCIIFITSTFPTFVNAMVNPIILIFNSLALRGFVRAGLRRAVISVGSMRSTQYSVRETSPPSLKEIPAPNIAEEAPTSDSNVPPPRGVLGPKLEKPAHCSTKPGEYFEKPLLNSLAKKVESRGRQRSNLFADRQVTPNSVKDKRAGERADALIILNQRNEDENKRIAARKKVLTNRLAGSAKESTDIKAIKGVESVATLSKIKDLKTVKRRVSAAALFARKSKAGPSNEPVPDNFTPPAFEMFGIKPRKRASVAVMVSRENVMTEAEPERKESLPILNKMQEPLQPSLMLKLLLEKETQQFTPPRYQ